MARDAADFTPPRKLRGGANVALCAAAASLVHCGCLVSAYLHYVSSMPSGVANDPDTQGAHTFQLVMVVVFAVVNLAYVAGLTWGGIVVRHGKPRGRVAIGTAGGCAAAVQLCCGLGGMLANASYRAQITDMRTDGDPDVRKFAETLDASSPLWQLNAGVIAGLLATVLALVAIVLLASAPASGYLRAFQKAAAPESRS